MSGDSDAREMKSGKRHEGQGSTVSYRWRSTTSRIRFEAMVRRLAFWGIQRFPMGKIRLEIVSASSVQGTSRVVGLQRSEDI